MLVNDYDIVYGMRAISGRNSLVFENSRLTQSVQVSIENFLVRFSMLSELIELLNVDVLGFTEDEFQNVIKELLEENSSTAETSKLIVCNVDLIQSIYSLPTVRYKQKAEEPERTEKQIEKFLQQINSKMKEIKKEYGYDFLFSDTAFINFRYGNEDGEIINIPKLYAKLFIKALSVLNTNNSLDVTSIQSQVDEFSSYLACKNIVLPVKTKKYSQYTTTHSRMKTLKENLLILAKTIGIYIFLSGDYDYVKPKSCESLIKFYEYVCKICMRFPNRFVPKELADEYKRFTDMYDYSSLSSKIQELSVANENK